ncbi:MAG: SiaC family regulatory phosphoprotein [Pseudomonadota bacterium]
MQSFITPATEDDPRIEYSDVLYTMTSSDTSLVNQADEFYGDYTRMIVEHLLENPQQLFKIEFRLEFVNSATQSAISWILNRTSDACAKASPGKIVQIR